jgi:peptidase E
LSWDQGWPVGWSSGANVQGTKILETSDAKVKKTIYFVSYALYLMWVTGSLYSPLFWFLY